MKFIVIEDNPDLNELLVEDLQSEGYDATGFLSVETYEAAGMVGAVYLLDLNLPGESGMSFAARLRARSPEAGIIVLTVRSGTEVRTQGYDTGVDIYLQKPCDRREILAAIKSMMRRISAPVPPPRGLTIYPARLLLAGPSGEVSITSSEATLFEALATAPEYILPYEQVMAILGARNAPSLATLEVRITRLRKKIANVLEDERAIASVRNVGYRLLVPVAIGGAVALVNPDEMR